MGHATWLDDGVTAVIDKLSALGQLDNTIILVFSDNTTMRGKGTCYDGGARTPCFLWGPGRVPEGVVFDKPVLNVDFAPTLFDFAGVTPPAEMQLDGMSLQPLLTDLQAPWRDVALLEIGHTRAVFTERWKYIALRYPPKMQQKIDSQTLGRPAYHMDVSLNLQETAMRAHPGYFDADQLYDLQTDPDEKVNLANDPQHVQTVAKLKTRLRKLLSDFNRPFGEFTN